MENSHEDQSGDVPVCASESAINFLKGIDDDDIESCIFKDQLVTVSDDNKTLGEFFVSIERVAHRGEALLLIHASSHGKVDDTPMGTTITAYVRTDFSIVEQVHHEYVKVPQHELEKNTKMTRDEETNSFHVERVVTQGNETRKSSHVFKLDELEGLITEGSNLLLQRLLAKSGMKAIDELTYITVDPDSGKLFPSLYKALPERTQMVGKQEIPVIGIERNVLSEKDLPCTWQCFFMDDGHLSMRVQVGSPSIAKLETVPMKVEKEIREAKPTFPKKPLNWEEDVEMQSRFFQRKEALKADHFTYLREKPDAQALLADFFQFLLLRKPDDVVTFAGEFFSSFSAVLPETSTYLRSSKIMPETEAEDE